jgi:hypothetical protein
MFTSTQCSSNIVQEKLEEQGARIKKILSRSHPNINLHEEIPKLTVLINYEGWFVEDIEWGITDEVFLQALAANQWWHFPAAMIRILLSYQVRNLKWQKYFTFDNKFSLLHQKQRILKALVKRMWRLHVICNIQR